MKDRYSHCMSDDQSLVGWVSGLVALSLPQLIGIVAFLAAQEMCHIQLVDIN